MIKIAFLINSLSHGGAERIIGNISCGLDNSFNKFILFINKSSIIDYKYSGVELYLNNFSNNSHIYKFINLLTRIFSLNKIIKNENFDIVLSFLEYPNLLNIISTRKGKKIISVRNNMSYKYSLHKGIWWYFAIKFLYKRSDLIIAISEGVKNDLSMNFDIPMKKIKVIYNPCDIESIKSLINDNVEENLLDIFSSFQVIITCGRLHEQKGTWHLLRAFSYAKKMNNNLKLFILGQGHLMSYLEKLTYDLNLTNDVYFLGFKKNPFKYFAKSKLFVLTSIYEGFGNVLLEAMASGIPIISTDCNFGPREIIAPNEINASSVDYGYKKGRNGVLIPIFDGVRYNANDKLTENEILLGNCINQLLDNPTIYLEQLTNCLNRVNDFSFDNTIHQWQDSFNEVLEISTGE
jgi:glycosyltransferase involved in cell wall biosynthesis